MAEPFIEASLFIPCVHNPTNEQY